MKKVKIVLQSMTGYMGSSENPEKMSLRFMGIMLAVVTQFAPLVMSTLGIDAVSIVHQLQPLVFSVASIIWILGLTRAVWTALKTSPLGAYLK